VIGEHPVGQVATGAGNAGKVQTACLAERID
jgi:hypothetical protein